MKFSGEQHRGESTERCTNEKWTLIKTTHDCFSVGHETNEPIIAIGSPTRIAMAAEVKSDRSPSALGQHRRCSRPGVPGLPATVQQEHRRRILWPALIGDENESSSTCHFKGPHDADATGSSSQVSCLS